MRVPKVIGGRETMQRLTVFRGGLIAVLVALIGVAPSALAEPDVADLFEGYRIEQWDCPAAGCGPLVIESQDEFAGYLADEGALRAAEAQARADHRGGGSGDDGGRGGKGKKKKGKGDDDQVVFVDFNNRDTTFDVIIDFQDGTFGLFGTFVSHLYTTEEQAAIMGRLRADFEEYDFEFVDVQPTSGEFTTLLFNDNDDPLNGPGITLVPAPGGGFFLSIGFGLADNIDFRNSVRSDNAGVDANFWGFLAQLDPSGGLFSSFSGLPVDAENPLAESLSTAVVNQTANTAAHELGHIIGLRHHDSFGPPGGGLPSTGVPSPFAFVPVFNGDQNAGETTLHLMASGASVGLSLSGSTIADRFLSERSAIKVALTEKAPDLTEEEAMERGAADEERGRGRGKGRRGLKLKRFDVPNTLAEGVNSDGRKLETRALVIEGAISVEGEADAYRIRGDAGDVITAELVSFTDRNVAEPIIGALSLFLEEEDGSLSFVATNFQTFEPFDPLLVDVELPADGTYQLVVDAPDVVFLDLDGDGFFDDPISLSAIGAGVFLTGDYELLVYSVEGPKGRRRGGKGRDDD
jgi:hypothetical protein